MKSVFLINGLVLFEPEQRRLCPLSGYPERAVILHGPVSECLLLLLEHNGEVLTQRYLFSAVWEKQGAIVSTNALYQTIASIRKALKMAGLAENVVQTVPKAGFKSIAHIQTGTVESFISLDVAAPESLPPESYIPPPCVTDSRFPFFSKKIAYGAASAVLFILSCTVLFQQLHVQDSGFKAYQPIGNIAGCDVYSSWHDKIKSQGIYTALTKRYPIQCNAGGVAYMTINRFQDGTSVIVCDKLPDIAGAQCDSIMYRKQYHEND
ncbi:OmpR/PhoB-type domain-containing protein [Enterobacter asburiae]|uniref:winged helix-turn-helix domain-containing protein n=1 Tax=Enterobacter asburiae TaxID=61645 RepID=UPI002003FE5F|nr:winged helix-turn-helix domain-containing protein [Enterobacter asburiae]MCK6785931.1 winged helix-turn-helix domain-containing protein [Enterobacter roggenkampii]MCK7358950.1 winged helix-turn-helix domain-containing protein [Enterobacter roggenkampii]MCM7836442.1 winged helix-turn-helix domain-containing protein [Enterobacter asburiae]